MVVVVEARDIVKGITAGSDEEGPQLLVHLFQCFQAVGGKAWTQHVYRSYALSGQCTQGLGGLGC